MCDRPFALVAQPVRIHHQATVVRTGDAPHVDPDTRRVDRHVHGHGNLILTLFVPRIRHTAAGQHTVLHRLRVRRGPRLPAEHLCGAFEHVDGPRVREAALAEGHRIGARRALHRALTYISSP